MFITNFAVYIEKWMDVDEACQAPKTKQPFRTFFEVLQFVNDKTSVFSTLCILLKEQSFVLHLKKSAQISAYCRCTGTKELPRLRSIENWVQGQRKRPKNCGLKDARRTQHCRLTTTNITKDCWLKAKKNNPCIKILIKNGEFSHFLFSARPPQK